MEENGLIQNQNAASLEREFRWLEQIMEARFQQYFAPDQPETPALPAPPDLVADPSTFARIVLEHGMTKEARVVLLLALAPHLKPGALDPFFMKNKLYDRGYSEFGGVVGLHYGGFLPTGDTVLFLLAGDDLSLRLQMIALFEETHYFFQHNILRLEISSSREPFLSGALTPSQEFLATLTSADGQYRPKFSAQFPAQAIKTNLEWKDLVLDSFVLDDIEEIKAWLQHHITLLDDWNLKRIIKPGYRALFYGPPGTGKTMTAGLLGKTMNLEVYRIDLSQVVSKYIGETEKNLANIFDRAEKNNWILFFDEADALFGKRTLTSDAKDRYANQEVAYLLQRIEDFPGVAILATNFKGNIDDAFTRRFQSMIYFPMPNPELRLKLWLNAFSGQPAMAPDIDWNMIAQQYELSGGAIINVLRHCALAAVRRDPPMVIKEDLQQGIWKELRKEGKSGVGQL
jgi:hypothetical protein